MADINIKDAKPFLEYKGRPLVRCGKTLYYGNLYDDYVVMMQIVDTVPFGDMNFAGKIIVTFNEQKAKELYEEYRFFDRNVVYYPARDILFYQSCSSRRIYKDFSLR